MSRFKRGVREHIRLLIGLAGGTGSGKTWTAMLLAQGLAGGKRFAVIDSENGRALHYADDFEFDHAEIKAPFRPQTYIDAVVDADKEGYPVIVVDSASHVWAGDGGCLEWHDEIVEEGVERKRKYAGDGKFEEWKVRESLNLSGWIEPKSEHKKMVTKLLQVRSHVILCFRAEPKVEMAKNDKGKFEIRAKESLTGLDGWIPVSEKGLPFELTMSLLFTADKPGVPKPIKLQHQHRRFIDLHTPITDAAGVQLGQWALGDPQLVAGRAAAAKGPEALKGWWDGVPRSLRPAYKPILDSELKPKAEAAGKAPGSAQAPAAPATATLASPDAGSPASGNDDGWGDKAFDDVAP